MATAKQKAASRRNLVKARAARHARPRSVGAHVLKPNTKATPLGSWLRTAPARAHYRVKPRPNHRWMERPLRRRRRL